MRFSRKLSFLIIFSLLLLGTTYLVSLKRSSLNGPFGFLLRRPVRKAEEIGRPPAQKISLRLPILVYHYVEDVTDQRDTLRQSIATRPSFFEGQLKYLKSNDYTVVTLDDLYRDLQGQTRLPEKSVILTFDDGYRDFYTDAYPLLKKYQIKALNYIIVNHLGRSGNLTEAMIKEMLASGLVTIGCHTLDHDYLPKDSPTQAREQIVDCKKRLEERFGVKVNHFAYPGGYYNPAVVEMVKEAGFATAVGTVPGVIHSLDNIYTLKRLHAGNLSPEVFGKHLQGPKEE